MITHMYKWINVHTQSKDNISDTTYLLGHTQHEVGSNNWSNMIKKSAVAAHQRTSIVGKYRIE